MHPGTNPREFVQQWLDANVEEGAAVVKSWLATHPQILGETVSKYQPTQRSQPTTSVALQTDHKMLSPMATTVAIKKPGILHRKSARELHSLNKQDLFMELLRDVVSPEFDIDSISHKILLNVLLLTNADRSSLFLVEGNPKNPILVSHLFDVKEDSTVESALHDEAEAIKIPIGVGIVGSVASTGEKINLKDVYKVSSTKSDILHLF